MTIALNKVTLADTDSTQLSYNVTTDPNPLQISSTGSITVVVYRANPPAIQCTQLQFSVVIGTSDTALTTSSNISTTCPTGWSLSSGGSGIFTFKPGSGSAMIGSDGLTFEFSNIAVNNQVGGTPLKIEETVTLNNQSQTNQTSFTLSKFPKTFNVQSFNAQPTSVAPGDTVTLSWSGSSSDSNTTYAYSLSYGSTNVSGLLPVANYPVYGLQVSTEFTLNVEAGGNALCQKQVYVTVEQPTITQFGIVGNPDIIPVGSTIELCWQTENVDHCALSLNGTPISGAISLPANSPSYSFTCPAAASGESQFTLTAFPGRQNNGGVASSSFVNIFKYNVLPNPVALSQGSQDISVSPDGSLLATSGDVINLISIAENQIVKTITGNTLLVDVTFNHDGTQVYCVAQTLPLSKSDVNSYDTSSGQLLSRSSEGTYLSIVRGSAQTSMIVAAIGGDSLYPEYMTSLSVLNPSDLTLAKSADFSPESVLNSLAANPQGDQILICCRLGLYNYQPGTNTVSELFSHTEFEPLAAVFSSDGNHYFVAATDGSEEFIVVVDAVQHQVIGKITLPAQLRSPGSIDPLYPYYASTMVAAPDGINFFVVLNNNTIAWIKLDSMEVYVCSQVGTSPCAIAMNPAGTCLYVIDTPPGKTFKVWTVEISDSN